ncbi:DNA processing protein DprA [Skermanella stibiiresistens SB22]|uniref:DNA processing protein DprA n=1 Tax=Skermanella stibiiresistens SB22 TaxID=1385369 RepID=W9H5N6_9PROT|nr:DNA-processing protein DprA [Skermanella stibiiresistens]EWY40091.1 DNA processing protein DprA [Skermanella stibiiresistens SB22]
MTQLRRALTDPERLDWLRLIRTENVGPVTFARLMERFDTAGQAITALPDLARRGGRKAPLKVCSKAEAEREVAAARKLGVRLIASCEPDYPIPLAATDDAPPIIAVRGHPHLLTKRCVAMVGARNASTNGKRFAESLARDLGAAGYVVVSGMARGIDTSAHQGAMERGTIAVVAGGVDVIYPEENGGLYARLVDQGAVVAECSLGTQPIARHFPRRNRVISGLSLGVVVVEATPKSGSLITARLAGEQGREVFAVPGSPLDPRCQGPNDLLRSGAHLTETVQDIINVLEAVAIPRMREKEGDLFSAAKGMQLDDASFEEIRDRLLECLGYSPVPVDELVRGCQLSASVVRSVLTELDLAGRVQQLPGNQVVLIQQ